MPGVWSRTSDEPVDKLLRLLKKQVERAGILYDLKRREAYLKPSVKKTLKSREARRKAAKEKRKKV